MEERYFVSVGGGQNQLPLIEAAKKNNLKVVTIDKNSRAIGFRFSDIKLVFSVDDYEEIFKNLFISVDKTQIVGIGTRSFGKATETTCYIADMLGLSYVSREDYLLYFSSKHYLKCIISEKNANIIPSFHIDDSFEFRNQMIVKPKNGSSKKDIFLLESKDAFLQFKQNFNFNEFIAEDFIEGDEITVLGLVHNRKFHLVSITDKLITKKAPFIEIAHIFPSKYDFLAGEVILNCQTLVFATNLINCPLVAEFKVTSENELFLIEAHPEVGGEFLADFLIKNYYKYDYFYNLVLLLTNQIFELPNEEKVENSLKSQINFYIPNNKKVRIQSIEDFKVRKHEECFLEKNLVNQSSIVSWEDGNHCRVKVVGVSTKDKISSKDFYHSIQSRLNESIKYISEN